MTVDPSNRSPSAQRARWAAKHPIAVGFLSGLAVAGGGIFLFDQSVPMALIISSVFGIAIWLGWRPGGWARRIEERQHKLDVD